VGGGINKIIVGAEGSF